MSLNSFDDAVGAAARVRREELTKAFDATIVSYYGPLVEPAPKVFRDFIEGERKLEQRDRLAVVLNTPGGTAEVVDKMVRIMRHHFEEVFFVVPDHAMSAGTILCMSGNKIFMDYASSLGPIDPQVPNNSGDLVPALGYLDQANKLLNSQVLTPGKAVVLTNLDLGTLDAYEHARELTIVLLRDWLVKYKFSTWGTHKTNPQKIGQAVTQQEKEERAQEIARMLSDNKQWQSHGRPIGIGALRSTLRLEIEDYSTDATLSESVRGYHDLLVGWAMTRKTPFLLHGKSLE